MQVGSWYQCGFELLADTALTNINVSGQVFMNFASGPGTSVLFMSNGAVQYENGMPLNVFNMDDEHNISRIISGERVGTLVTTTPSEEEGSGGR